MNPNIPQGGIQTTPTSPTRGSKDKDKDKDKDENFERPRRTSSMVLNPGSSVAPQPTYEGVPQPQPFVEDERHHMRGGSGNMALDGIEPRIFPGVVSRRRRSSLRGSSVDMGAVESESAAGVQGQNSGPTRSGFARGAGEEDAVVEERE